MHLGQLLKATQTTFSFEFFPPKTDEATAQLLHRAAEMAQLRPSFVSVTYGAGGSTRDRTRDIVVQLQEQIGLTAAAHLTCVGHSRAELIDILETYRQRGVHNLVALRGDAPPGTTFTPHPDGLSHADQLVALIREHFGAHFGIAVAGYPEGHPETPNKLTDLDHLKRKVDCGADAVITQLFFDNRDFYDFCDRCVLAGIPVPIIAGIMPVLSSKGAMRMAGLCGSRIPAKLLGRLQKAGDNEQSVAHVGIDWAVQQARDLLENQARGVHFYTLNRSNATLEIYRRLGAADSQTLANLAER